MIRTRLWPALLATALALAALGVVAAWPMLTGDQRSVTASPAHPHPSDTRTYPI